jgi:dihydrofolate reductase
MSLDGYIAGPGGEYDWIVLDPDLDFSGMLKQFDTFLIGRKTFEVMQQMGHDAKPTAGIQKHRVLTHVETCRLPSRRRE